MTISQFVALPDWEKNHLFKYEADRVIKLTDIIESMADQEKLTAEAYATLMQSLFG